MSATRSPKLKSAHAIAKLIDFPDDIVAHYKRWPAGRCLRVEMASDQCVSVLKARSEHADPHFAGTSRRHGSVDNLQALGIAEAPELNNARGLITCESLQSHIP